MIHDAVKTKARAYNMLLERAESLKLEHGYIRGMYHSYPDTQCECGQTGSLQLHLFFADGSDKYISCAICDTCGNDDAFPEDVIY